MRFTKMHGLGNDFAVVDARAEGAFAPDAAAVRAMADRRAGIGFDQLVAILPPRNGAVARLALWNADGGTISTCGNATRCVAGVLMGEGGTDRLLLESDAGPLACTRLADGRVAVEMGVPRFGWRDIPLAREADTAKLPISLEGVSGTGVNIGNPHAVFFVPDAEAVPLERLGPAIEHDPLFPERVNVETATVLAPDRIRMRVWERGAGITMACGSGACATLAAAVRLGLTGRAATLLLDGGALDISWPADDAPVTMTGPWAVAYTGEWPD